MTIPVSLIAEAIGAAPLPCASRQISGWSIDSRTLNHGDCFFALRGPAHDGHSYVAGLAAKGAALAVVDHAIEAPVPQLVVPETGAALTKLAAFARQRWNGLAVCVTGSAGKTTTKDVIAALLAADRRTGSTIGNLNNHFGLPLSILRLADDCEAAVLELGMNHAAEIRSLARIAQPQIGVVTNAGWAHAENFPDGIEGVARAKRELIEELPRSGTAILNADDPRVREYARIFPGRSILYGLSDDAEVRAENVHLSGQCAHFRCLGVEFASPLAGRHGVLNALAGIAAARALGIDPARLVGAVRSLATGKMRGERFERNGVTIIDDCYNANPEAMRSMLELLRNSPAARRIAVLGEMLELGRKAGTLHRDVGRFAAELGIDALVGIRGAARFMADEAVKAGLSGSAAYFFNSPEEAGDFLRGFVRPGDAVLFKGSRGVAVEKAIAHAFPLPGAAEVN